MLKTFCSLTTILLLLVCCGCSRDNRPKDLPRLFPVTLTVLLDDQPLSDAIVMLYAENGVDARWTIGGQTDDGGKAVIVTHGQFHGVPAGKFKVCVTKKSSGAGSTAPASGTLSVYGGSAPMSPEALKDIVDPLFSDPASTPLEVEISPKGKEMTSLTLNVHKPR